MNTSRMRKRAQQAVTEHPAVVLLPEWMSLEKDYQGNYFIQVDDDVSDSRLREAMAVARELRMRFLVRDTTPRCRALGTEIGYPYPCVRKPGHYPATQHAYGGIFWGEGARR